MGSQRANTSCKDKPASQRFQIRFWRVTGKIVDRRRQKKKPNDRETGQESKKSGGEGRL